MATFSWNATSQGAGSTNPWETPADWTNLTNPGTLISSFTSPPANDFIIGASNSNLFTIDNIGAGGTGTPDIANSLTVVDFQARLLFAAGGALDVATTLSLNSLMNMGTAGVAENSVLSMGGPGGGGIITLGTNGLLEGAVGDKVLDIGTSDTTINGSGEILAQGGVFSFGTSVQVATGTTLKFDINPNTTLSFADTVGSGTVVFTTNSGSGVLDVGAFSSFGASVKGLSVGTVAGVAADTSYIDFTNVGTTATASLTGITTSGATLTVFGSGGSVAIPIIGNYSTADINGRFTHVNWSSDGNTGTDVFFTDLPCYAAGTAIQTPHGEVAVEMLQAGDVVMTHEAGRFVPQPVRWAGHREINLTRHPKPASVAPIRFRRGALGCDQPRRDLLLSPDHCLFIDGGLVPARLLVNGMTIVRDLTLRSISYHHIELDRHAVLIAEGVEAESYLDTGNRAFFSNAGLAMILHPELGINEGLRCRETNACAPLMSRPESVRPLWERFATLARSLGFAEPERETTTDSCLRLVVDGKTVWPLATRDDMISFVVPEDAGSVRLVSRRGTPGEQRPWLDDTRVLGVAVRSMTLRDRTGDTVLDADHPALTDGWHAAEHSAEGVPWRWTDGDAVLPIASDGPCLLQIILSAGMTYAADRLAA